MPPIDSFNRVLVCAWCGRWIGSKDTDCWHPAETLPADISAISHGMCPSCRQQLGSGIRKGFRRDSAGQGDGDGRR